MTINVLRIPNTTVLCACGAESDPVTTTITPANDAEGELMQAKADAPEGWTEDEHGELRCTGCSAQIIE